MGDSSCMLVTGGAGFIGSHLVEHLVAEGATVTVVDDFRTGSASNLDTVAENIELIKGSLAHLLRSGALNLSAFGTVFHLAANAYIPPSVESPLYDFETNVLTTLLLLEDLRRLSTPPRLVFGSSAAVYGNPVRLPITETDLTIPISPYGVGKLAAERYVAVFSQIYGLEALSMRLFSVYGPRQRKQVVYDLLDRTRKNPARLSIIGDGTQTRDFVFVGDVARAGLLLARSAPARGEVYNVASGRTVTIATLAEMICSTCSAEPDIAYTGSIRDGDAQNWTVDIARLMELGYRAECALEDGLRATVEWYDRAATA